MAQATISSGLCSPLLWAEGRLRGARPTSWTPPSLSPNLTGLGSALAWEGPISSQPEVTSAAGTPQAAPLSSCWDKKKNSIVWYKRSFNAIWLLGPSATIIPCTQCSCHTSKAFCKKKEKEKIPSHFLKYPPYPSLLNVQNCNIIGLVHSLPYLWILSWSSIRLCSLCYL